MIKKFTKDFAIDIDRELYPVQEKVFFEYDRGKIKNFRIEVIVLVAGSWKELRRYDTAHEKVHVHKFGPSGNCEILKLENGDNKTLFHNALEDCKKNTTKWLVDYLIKRGD